MPLTSTHRPSSLAVDDCTSYQLSLGLHIVTWLRAASRLEYDVKSGHDGFINGVMVLASQKLRFR